MINYDDDDELMTDISFNASMPRVAFEKYGISPTFFLVKCSKRRQNEGRLLSFMLYIF